MVDELDDIPFIAIGNDEIDPKAKKRIDKLWENLEGNEVKFLSLVISRGKTEDGKFVTCSTCGNMYLIFPDETKKCDCGEILE